MTTSGRSSVSGFSPQRRSLLIGGASVAALATVGSTATAAAGASAASAAAPIDFDLESGNFIRDLIARSDRNTFEELVAPMDVTLLMRFTHATSVGWFDAVAPYHPTAVGFYSRLGRRPAGEAATNRNKNIAGLHATYQVVKGLIPDRLPEFQTLFEAVGLNPGDESQDKTSPVGIGNLAGKAVVAHFQRDGMNMLGDEGREYHGRPYEDYTGYAPVNSAYKLVHPSRWQPQSGPHRRRNLREGAGDKGVFIVQQFVTPQMRLVKPHSYQDPGKYRLAPPNHIDHTNMRAYKRSVDEVVEAQANLTDEQKVKAEFFDNKLLGIGQSGKAAASAHELDLDGWVHLFATNSTAIYDALIAAWYQKNKYDVVRPSSAVRHVYGRSKLTAWGGPGVGTVRNMPGSEWMPYLNVGDHPEYPSGSTTLCSAEAQATRRFFDDDVLDWRHVAPAGSTEVERGISPAKDVELYWSTWTDFVKDCAISRVWGGVHFKKTIERSVVFGEQFGDLAYEFVQKQIKGDVKH
ncbi:vanadium-dependent haloperoxidase [Streptomyces sp. NBC_00457]|uniref:vanadium-dependent haloperoxidase n=1 Tax=Streptomyces sp. NBC_00457 TaxID=2975748 RepID=UPI002E1F6CE3